MCPWGSLQGAVPAGDQMGLAPLRACGSIPEKHKSLVKTTEWGHGGKGWGAWAGGMKWRCGRIVSRDRHPRASARLHLVPRRRSCRLLPGRVKPCTHRL